MNTATQEQLDRFATGLASDIGDVGEIVEIEMWEPRGSGWGWQWRITLSTEFAALRVFHKNAGVFGIKAFKCQTGGWCVVARPFPDDLVRLYCSEG